MHILVVNSLEAGGGSELWTIRTMASLRQRGHRLGICCRPGTALALRADAEGFPVHQINFRGDLDPLTIARFAYLLLSRRIHVVLTNFPKDLSLVGLASRILPRRIAVIHRHAADARLKNSALCRFVFGKVANRIIVHSEASKKTLLRNSRWLSEERIEIVYQGIDPGPFEAAEGKKLRKKWRIREGAPLLGFVGPLDGRKGIGVLLTAFEAVLKQEPGAELVIVGEGPLREMIESEIRLKRWQSKVHIAGFVDDIAEAMRAIDVLVLPSFSEGFSSVLIEAMAAQRPVISTNSSSMPEIIEEGSTGFMVPPGDSEAMAARAVCLLRDAGLRDQLGANGLNRVQRMFSHNAMINHLEAIMKREAGL